MLRYSRMNKTHNNKGLYQSKYIEERLIIEINRFEALEFIIIDDDVKYRKRYIDEVKPAEFKEIGVFHEEYKCGIKISTCIIEDQIYNLPMIG